MKTLFLLRHAKSSWKDSSAHDHDRRLKRRGRRQARKIGRYLAEQNLLPDMLVTSTAKRCRKTSDQLIDASGYRGETRITGDLYEADGNRLREFISRLDGDAPRLMLVAHNPGLEELIESLTGTRTPLSTGSLAQIELPIERWSDLNGETRGTLVNVTQSQDL
jgi:phosphohistidine phosphatase